MTHTSGNNVSLLLRAAAVAACLAAGLPAAAAQAGARSAGVERAPRGGTSRATATVLGVQRPLARASMVIPDPSATPAPPLVIDGPLTLCGGAPVPTTIADTATLCLEQELTGMTEELLLNRSLEVDGVNLTFAAGPHTRPLFSST